MDGHVEFVKLNTKYPVQANFDPATLEWWMAIYMTNMGGQG